jgi:hypothetical protein
VLSALGQVLLIPVQLLLRVHILQQLSLVPPSIIKISTSV